MVEAPPRNIVYRNKGDLLAEEAEALVNTVNCVGVMGKGVALAFRKAFPDNYRTYARACARREIQPGKMLVWERPSQPDIWDAPSSSSFPRYIINFPTKTHWRSKSRLEIIDAGLAALVEEIRSRGIRSIALPALGCGNGGLNWNDVRPRIENALGNLRVDGRDVRATIFEPDAIPSSPRSGKTLPPKSSPHPRPLRTG